MEVVNMRKLALLGATAEQLDAYIWTGIRISETDNGKFIVHGKEKDLECDIDELLRLLQKFYDTLE